MPPKPANTTAPAEQQKPAELAAETKSAEVAEQPVAKPDLNVGKVRCKVINGKFAGVKPSDPNPFVYVTKEQLKNFRNVLVEATLSEADPVLRTAAQ